MSLRTCFEFAREFRNTFSRTRENCAHARVQNLRARAHACRNSVRTCAQKFSVVHARAHENSGKFRARAPENPGNPSPVRPTSIFPRSKSPNDFEKCATREINQAVIRGGIFRVLRGLGGGRGSWGGFAGGARECARVCAGVCASVHECAGGAGAVWKTFRGMFSQENPPTGRPPKKCAKCALGGVFGGMCSEAKNRSFWGFVLGELFRGIVLEAQARQWNIY